MGLGRNPGAEGVFVVATLGTLKAARAALVLVLAALLAGCGVIGQAAAPTTVPLNPGSVVVAPTSTLLDTAGVVPAVGDQAPDFAFTLTDGTTQRLSDLRGKKVLINFWATWCAPCRLEMPELQAASVKYADQLVVLAVNRVESPSDIVAFGKEFNTTFPLITDREAAICNRYGAQNLPTTYLINSDGTVAERHLGPIDRQFIADRLAAMH